MKIKYINNINKLFPGSCTWTEKTVINDVLFIFQVHKSYQERSFNAQVLHLRVLMFFNPAYKLLFEQTAQVLQQLV